MNIWTAKTTGHIEKGDRVLVRGGFGIDPARWADVTETGDEKNGRQVFCIQFLGAEGENWCYRDQIDAVWQLEAAA